MAAGVRKLTDTEISRLMESDHAWNRARRVFSGESGRIEQAMQQKTTLSILELRRMEFEAVRKIALALGMEVSL